MFTYSLKLIEIRQETSDTITLCFKQPGLKRVKYLAGQYLTLIFRINGRRYLRPYSFSSSPFTEQNLEVTIKRFPGGMISNHIHDVVKPGDTIEVLPPMGDFVLRKGSHSDVFMWGVGSGITPLMSLTKQVLSEGSFQKVTLVYGNRNPGSTIFTSQIEGLQAKYPDRFKVFHFHSQYEAGNSSATVLAGRITIERINDVLKHNGIINSNHYICGPKNFKEMIISALKPLGVNKEQILTEDFELIKDPEDFKDILTRFIKLTFNNKEYKIEVPKGKNILETALDAGIELPYSCQTGSCSTCKGRLNAGNIKMIGLSKDRNDLMANECLLCCTYPMDDAVEVELN